MAAGEVEQVGDGAYRMQPIAVRDAAAAVVAGVGGPTPAPAPGRGPHRVIDLVGPQAISFHDFVEALAAVARKRRRPAEFRLGTISVEEADRRARDGTGMPPEELDCVLCDEISDTRALESLLGRFLTPLEEALDAAVRGTPPRG
jgi:nucleoside-diphosphate-sugar epimerase